MKLRECLFAFAAVAMTSAAQAQSSEIVFSSDRPGLPMDFDIWRMDEDGTPQNRLTSEIGDTRRPSKSFDGQKIVYDNNSDLLMINSNGTGSQIAFASERQAIDMTTDWEIWVVNQDLTGMPVNLTDAAGDDDDPDWGPVKLP